MPALDFPSSPSNGDTYNSFIYNSTTGAWQSLAVTESNLEDLSDVEIVLPQDGDVLSYSSSTESWKNTYNHYDSLQLTKTNPEFNENTSIPSGYNGTLIGPLLIGEFAELDIADDSTLIVF
jgi:hypothetical protein